MELDTPNPVPGTGVRFSDRSVPECLPQAPRRRTPAGTQSSSTTLDPDRLLGFSLVVTRDGETVGPGVPVQLTEQALSALAEGSLQRVIVRAVSAHPETDGLAGLQRIIAEIARVLAWGGDLFVASGPTGEDWALGAMAIVDMTVPHGFVVVDLCLDHGSSAVGGWIPEREGRRTEEAALAPVFHLRKAIR